MCLRRNSSKQARISVSGSERAHAGPSFIMFITDMRQNYAANQFPLKERKSLNKWETGRKLQHFSSEELKSVKF